MDLLTGWTVLVSTVHAANPEQALCAPLEAVLEDARGRPVAVASLRPFSRWPMRGFAQRGVADAERAYRVPVLIDWQHTLAGAGQLPAAGASVMLLDADGGVRFRHTGALRPQDREAVFRLLAELLGVDDRPE